jgi:hypothetical protein
MSKHYTAVIKISKTEHSTPEGRLPGRVEPPKSDGTREVTEVATVTIRADSIEALITKATAHLTLVED